MKFLTFSLVLLSLTVALVHCASLNAGEIQTFEQFKNIFNKKYSSVEEETKRKRNFEESLETIKKNNVLHQKDGTVFAVNEFSDLSDEEFYSINGGVPQSEIKKMMEQIPVQVPSFDEYETLPKSIDWRNKTHFNPIENQGQCGACWAFASLFAVEAAYSIKKNTNVRLSKQQVVDCTLHSYNSSYHSSGCNSGYTTEAMAYTHVHGVVTEDRYPYHARNGHCDLAKINSAPSYRISGYSRLSYAGDDDSIRKILVNNGPVVVNINSENNAFRYYHSGIIRNEMPNQRITTHSVAIVGYGTENDVDYWLIRNQWGATWGDHGYVKIERHINSMGINDWPLYPKL